MGEAPVPRGGTETNDCADCNNRKGSGTSNDVGAAKCYCVEPRSSGSKRPENGAEVGLEDGYGTEWREFVKAVVHVLEGHQDSMDGLMREQRGIKMLQMAGRFMNDALNVAKSAGGCGMVAPYWSVVVSGLLMPTYLSAHAPLGAL